MKTIVPGSGKVLRLLGAQKPQKTPYRLSRTLLRAGHPDGTLLHNTLTGQLVLLDGPEAAALERLPALPEEVPGGLIEGWFLVPEKHDEASEVRKLRYLMRRLFEPKGVNGYTILTTTGCNARCFYCYESGIPVVHMTAETADRLTAFMAANRSEERLSLEWFGGEPLLNAERIDQICRGLKERGIPFTSAMTTNGYLFTEALADRAAAEWALRTVQITLDGTQAVYDRTKAYVNAEGSPYRRVLRNIRLLLDRKVRVIIRLNLDQHNSEDLDLLASELKGLVRKGDPIHVYTHVLFEDAGPDPIPRSAQDREVLYRKQVRLNTELERLGLSSGRRALPTLKMHNCIADVGSALVVYPDGKLFKCEHVELGHPVGSLETGVTDREAAAFFRETAERPECPACPLYPSCMTLKNCPGAADKNEHTCRYEIESATRSLLRRYEREKNRAAGGKQAENA